MSVSIFLIAHSPLAQALKDCAVHVYSCDKRTAERVRAFDVLPDSDTDAVAGLVTSALGTEKNTDGILILTDVVGATPSNIAHRMLKHDKVTVIAGVNLPMVLTALCHRDETLENVTKLVKEAGMMSIIEGTLEHH